MPKATIRLATGATVNIEGTAGEIKELLSLYGRPNVEISTPSKHPSSIKLTHKTSSPNEQDDVSISEIVTHVKDCEDADDIESRILDKTSQVNRILLPLFIIQKHMSRRQGLTTGEISTITKDLGIPIHVANISNALKGSAARYVIGDKVRRQGQAVRYTLSRRGFSYIENVIKGNSHGE